MPGASDREGRIAPLLASGTLFVIFVAQLLLPLDAAQPVLPGLAARRTRPIAIPPPLPAAGILAAPIFAPDRRPAANGSDVSGAANPLAGFAAQGAATGGGIATAVVSTPGGQVRVVKSGDDLGGWRVAAIERTRLILERHGVRVVLVVGAPAVPIKDASDPASTATTAPQ